jgi:hypothetical protein
MGKNSGLLCKILSTLIVPDFTIIYIEPQNNLKRLLVSNTLLRERVVGIRVALFPALYRCVTIPIKPNPS